MRCRRAAWPKKKTARLLTLRKTVIRFRQSRRFLRKRVRKIITTTRSAKRTSASAVKTVDAGFLSPAKRFGAIRGMRPATQPGSPLAGRVFICRTLDGRSLAAVSARFQSPSPAVGAGPYRIRFDVHARWRLAAGSPAALFSTGP
jgi:hypothetical protein